MKLYDLMEMVDKQLGDGNPSIREYLEGVRAKRVEAHVRKIRQRYIL